MKQKGDVQVRQAAAQFPLRNPMKPGVFFPFIAQVEKVYSERMTCDVLTADGQRLPNIPVKCKAGTIDGSPYGEVDLPAEGDFVIVSQSSFGKQQRIIEGSYIPYLSEAFSKPPVKSANKQFDTVMLEEDKPIDYKRIFKSGTSISVVEDGTITIETPSGTYFRINETDGIWELKDSHGNAYTMNADGIVISDLNGNTYTLNASGIAVEDANQNRYTLSSSGITLEDSGGNTIVMGSAKVAINGNLEVLQ